MDGCPPHNRSQNLSLDRDFGRADNCRVVPEPDSN
jgi:hypothetical protein